MTIRTRLCETCLVSFSTAEQSVLVIMLLAANGLLGDDGILRPGISYHAAVNELIEVETSPREVINRLTLANKRTKLWSINNTRWLKLPTKLGDFELEKDGTCLILLKEILEGDFYQRWDDLFPSEDELRLGCSHASVPD